MSTVERRRPAGPNRMDQPMLQTTGQTAGDTLVEGLVEGAQRHPYAVTFFPGDNEGIDIGDLEDSSARRAAALSAQGVGPGTLTGLLVTPGAEFLADFFAVLRAGGVVTLLPTSTRAAHYDLEVDRLSQLIRLAGVSCLVTGGPLAERLCAANPELRPVHPDGGHRRSALAPVHTGQRALVLFTAGRTGPPKAVARSHGQLMSGMQAFRGALGMTSDDILVQWLPLSHPLSLFGLLSQVLYGGTTHVFPPAVCHGRPGDILRCIAEHHANVTIGTNSSYELLCTVATALASDVDLGRWRVALNGGEPVQAGTVDRFRRVFAGHGVRRTTMHPMYYVTEAMLAVTGKLPDTAPDVLTIDQRTLFDSGKIRFIRSEQARMRSYVSSGVPVPGIDFRIADAEGADAGNGVLGEIQIRSATVGGGYHRDLRATLKSMDGGWFRTGDTGFLWRGQLFVAGYEDES